MRIITDEKGMTLVEVLLGLAIIGIIAVLMGSVFVNGLGMVSRAGDLDRTGYTAAKVTENAIDGQDFVVSGDDIKINEEIVANTAIPLDAEKMITIKFDDTGKSLDVYGDQKKITSTGYRNDVTIEVFIPHEKE